MKPQSTATLGIVFSLWLALSLGCANSSPVNLNSPPVTSPTPTPAPTSTPTLTAEPVMDVGKEIEQFRQVLKSVDAKGSLVKDATEGRSKDTLNIIATNNWHSQPYQIRLQTTQVLWKAWAAIHSPKEPDKARISVRDITGNEVGGSRVWAGSLIWVQEK